MKPDTANVDRAPMLSRLWPRRIGLRLSLGFGGLVALMLVSLTLATLQVNRITEITQQFATGDMQRLLRVQGLTLQVEGVGSAIILLMNAPREHRVAEYADVDQRNRNIEGIIGSLSASMQDPVQALTLQRLMACRALYSTAFITMADEIEGEDLKAAALILNSEVNPALKAMLVESNALLQRERLNVEAQLEESQQLFERVAMGVGVLALVAACLAALLGWGTTQSVVKPLAQLSAAAKRIARGDYTTRVSATSAQEVDRVGQALNTMTDAVAERERQIVQLAFHDALTQLPNRSALLKRHADGGVGMDCLILMDLARLKVINETLGYGTGDTLIQEVAARTTTVLAHNTGSSSDGAGDLFLAHLWGGRFAISLHAPERAVVDQLRQSLEYAMAKPVLCSGHSVDLSLGFGLADSAQDGPALALTTLLRNAEIALFAAKKAAVSFAWYGAEQEAARLSHLGLLSDLRLAVANSQLQMWLQPKFSLTTGLAVGAEALVRWQHPQRGFISPAEFVPFAEKVGYIGMITHWMLDEALRTLAAWAPSQPGLSIAVNVSTRDLQNPNFCDLVSQRIKHYGVPPERLRLELVESGLMEDPQSGVAALHALRNLGVKLSIDDFGTGYSSLSYLQQLPVSELKIDRSFIDRIDALPGTQLLVKTMIEMGHGMGLMVTAEGVETPAERDTITRLGCDVMQGYLGSRPLHGDALAAWFAALPVFAPGQMAPA